MQKIQAWDDLDPQFLSVGGLFARELISPEIPN